MRDEFVAAIDNIITKLGSFPNCEDFLKYLEDCYTDKNDYEFGLEANGSISKKDKIYIISNVLLVANGEDYENPTTALSYERISELTENQPGSPEGDKIAETLEGVRKELVDNFDSVKANLRDILQCWKSEIRVNDELIKKIEEEHDLRSEIIGPMGEDSGLMDFIITTHGWINSIIMEYVRSEEDIPRREVAAESGSPVLDYQVLYRN